MGIPAGYDESEWLRIDPWICGLDKLWPEASDALGKIFANRCLGQVIDNSETALRERHKHLVEFYHALHSENRALVRNGMRLDKDKNIVEAKYIKEK